MLVPEGKHKWQYFMAEMRVSLKSNEQLEEAGHSEHETVEVEEETKF